METANRAKERGRSFGKRRGKEGNARKGRGAAAAGVLGGGSGADGGPESSGGPAVGGGPETRGEHLAAKLSGLPSGIADAVVSDEWEAELQEVPSPVRGKTKVQQDVSHPDPTLSVRTTRLGKHKKASKTENPKSAEKAAAVKRDKPKWIQPFVPVKVDEGKNTQAVAPVKPVKVDKVKSLQVKKPQKEQVLSQPDKTDENRNMLEVQKAREHTQLIINKHTASPADKVLDRILSPESMAKAKTLNKTKIPTAESEDKATEQEKTKKDMFEECNWWSDKDTDKEDVILMAGDCKAMSKRNNESREELGKEEEEERRDLLSPRMPVKRKECDDRAQMPPPTLPLSDTPVSWQNKKRKPKRKATPMPPRGLGLRAYRESIVERMTMSAPSSRLPSRDASPDLRKRASKSSVESQPPPAVSPTWEDYKREGLNDSGSETSSLEQNLSLASQEDLEFGRYGDDEEEGNSDPHVAQHGPDSAHGQNNGCFPPYGFHREANTDELQGFNFPPKQPPGFQSEVNRAQVHDFNFPPKQSPGFQREANTAQTRHFNFPPKQSPRYQSEDFNFPPQPSPEFQSEPNTGQTHGSSFPLRAPPGFHLAARDETRSLQMSTSRDGAHSPEMTPLPPHLAQKAHNLQQQVHHFFYLSQSHYNFALHTFHKALSINNEYMTVVGGNPHSPPPLPLLPAQPGTNGPVFPYPPPAHPHPPPPHPHGADIPLQYPPPVPPPPPQAAGPSHIFFPGPYSPHMEQQGDHWASEPVQQAGKCNNMSPAPSSERNRFNLPPGHYEIPPRMWKKAATSETGAPGKYVIPAYRSGSAKWKSEQGWDTSDETSSSMTSPPHKRKMVVSWPSLLEVSYVWQVGVKDAGYIDSHCHIDYMFEKMSFRESFQAFMSKANFPSNFEGCVAVFCDPKSWHSDGLWRSLLEENDNVWGAFGCHPHSARLYNSAAEENLLQCFNHEKVIAFGEIGLDNSKAISPASVQRQVFMRQLHLALKLGKPLVLHCREADAEMLEMMQGVVPRDYIIHRHCFTESFDIALRWMEAYPNMYLGITALVTYHTTRKLQDAVRRIPLDRLLLETDAPYFVPRQIPQGKVAYSHPAMAVCVAEKIAELKCIPLSTVLQAVRENTRTVYGI